MAVTETISLMLTGSESYISSTGQKFLKGEIYPIEKGEAIKLLAIKGDYDLRFFKKHEGEKGVRATPVETADQAVLPTQEAIAADMRQDAVEATAKAMAAQAADVAATASRGTETIDSTAMAEKLVANQAPIATPETGEMDTAAQPIARKRGTGVAV
jgi:hypothetical protein